ncbi:MAG: DUF4349 domain-containing protein [Dehalococcoidia bacterium]|nr:DUF4349 domain-containing protein [Dehalococcoidia bacterium]
MSAVASAFRAVNHRLLILAAVLLALGMIWAAWVTAGSPGRGQDDSASLDSGGGFGGTTSVEPAPGVMPPVATDGGFAVPEESKGESGAGVTGSGGDYQVPQGLGRTVIRNGQLQLQVESVSATFDRVRLVTEAAGGYVADSTISGRDEHQSAWLTIRIPADRFAQVVTELQGLAVEVDGFSTNSQDVTEEYADLQATIRNLKAVESQYLELLGRAQDIGEVLQVQDRLNQVRLQIDQVQGRINLLDALTSLATLTVYLTPVSDIVDTEPLDSIGDAVREAWEASLDTLESIARGVLVALVYSWWIIPLLLVGGFLARRALTRRTPAEADSGRVDTPEGAA